VVRSAAQDLAFEVKIKKLEHVPKEHGLLHGSAVDPYVLVEYAGQPYKTHVVKNHKTGDRDFEDETFLIPIRDNSVGVMMFSVWDWHRLGKNEVIGRFEIDRATIANMITEGKDKSYPHKSTLKTLKGDTVVGQDGSNSQLSVDIAVVEDLPKELAKSGTKATPGQNVLKKGDATSAKSFEHGNQI